jgi:alpha-tubulin suppressor-like RCC1 family protein
MSTVPVAVSGGYSFASVDGGDDHTCGVTTAGAAYCWGLNRAGQLGNGTSGTNRNSPVAVSQP